MISNDIIESKLIKYCDDIIPIKRNLIYEFFKDLNAPYREDHIDFLEKFGGNNPSFLKNIEVDCSFEEIKDLYSDELITKELPADACHFLEHKNIMDPCCINRENGKIYSYDYNEYYSLYYNNISGLICYGLITNNYIKRYSQSMSKIDEMSDKDIEFFLKENDKFKLDIYIYGTTFFLKDKELYIFAEIEDGWLPILCLKIY